MDVCTDYGGHCLGSDFLATLSNSIRRLPYPLIISGIARSLAVSISRENLCKFPPILRVYSFLHQNFKPHGIVALDILKTRIYVDSEDIGVSRSLLMWGTYEDYVTNFLQKAVKKGMVVLDVGANIGYYTILASRLVGDEGMVFAFEPEPRNYALLCQNLNANRCNNVLAVQKAVYRRNSQVKLHLDRTNFGAHSLLSTNVFDHCDAIEVEAVSLDDFFRDRGLNVDVVKMSVQGLEMGVLQGMTNMIRHHKDLKIITAFWPAGLSRSGSSPMEFIDSLKRYGFRIFEIGPCMKITEFRPELNMPKGDSYVRLLITRSNMEESVRPMN